jgi:hypothetical protein
VPRSHGTDAASSLRSTTAPRCTTGCHTDWRSILRVPTLNAINAHFGLQVDFVAPDFGLIERSSQLEEELFKRLYPRFISFPDFSVFHERMPLEARLDVRLSRLRAFASIRLHRLDFRCDDVFQVNRQELTQAAGLILDALANLPQPPAPSVSWAWVNYIGILQEMTASELLSRYVRRPQLSIGEYLGPGVAFYFDANGIWTSVSLDKALPGNQNGLSVRVSIQWNPQSLQGKGFEEKGVEYFQRIIRSLEEQEKIVIVEGKK